MILPILLVLLLKIMKLTTDLSKIVDLVIVLALLELNITDVPRKKIANLILLLNGTMILSKVQELGGEKLKTEVVSNPVTIVPNCLGVNVLLVILDSILLKVNLNV